MTLTLDQADRVELPKLVLDLLGLVPGTELEIQVETDGELRLRVKSTEPSLSVANDVLVHRGQAAAGIDWNGVLERECEERLQAPGHFK